MDARTSKTFKFEEMWYEKPECLKNIKDSWSRGGRISRGEEYNLNMKACREDLIGWSRQNFGNNWIEIERTKRRLLVLGSSRPSPQILVEEKVMKSKLHAL